VEEGDLPVELPTQGVKLKGKGSILKDMADWQNTSCPRYPIMKNEWMVTKS